MKSAFLSEVFHAFAAGESFSMPVSEGARTWLTSLQCAASNFAHAISADLADTPAARAVTLPALRVRISDLVAELARQTGHDAGAVSYDPDAELEAGFAAHPPLATDAADALGFRNDGDLDGLVAAALDSLREEDDG